MARYKHTEAESEQGFFLSVNLKEQLLPGTFECMLNDLIGKRTDISMFAKTTGMTRQGQRPYRRGH